MKAKIIFLTLFTAVSLLILTSCSKGTCIVDCVYTSSEYYHTSTTTYTEEMTEGHCSRIALAEESSSSNCSYEWE